MNRIAIIGGTGAAGLIPEEASQQLIATPHGDPSSPMLKWESGVTETLFIARHGLDGSIPPHRINYRANIWALKDAQPDFIIAINAVGGIDVNVPPGHLVFPDQLIDYTWGRAHTFDDGTGKSLQHIDFTVPFSEVTRMRLISEAKALGLDYSAAGTYAVTQGPRLETAAEIDRLERDGCHIVGMTAMPEAALSRELEIPYAICAVVVNWAAGRTRSGEGIHDEIHASIDHGLAQVRRLLGAL
jgi:5'-methylthioinosine phosphorylase